MLVGDLIYAGMARRLARRTGRDDVTAMPLGLNAPSVFGMSFAVLPDTMMRLLETLSQAMAAMV